MSGQAGPVLEKFPRCGTKGEEGHCGGKGIGHDPPVEDRRRQWGQHDVQCQIVNRRPVCDPDPGGPVQCTLPGYLDGYPLCSFVNGHLPPCDYRRHAAEKPAGT